MRPKCHVVVIMLLEGYDAVQVIIIIGLCKKEKNLISNATALNGLQPLLKFLH